MILDEAIKHAEEVAEENSKSYEEWLACRGNVGWSKSDIEAVDKSIEQCKKCDEEHRQLAEWLKELKAHRKAWEKAKRTVKAYLMLEGFGSAYQDDIENLIEGCIPKEGDME